MTEFQAICLSAAVALAAFLLFCVGMILNSCEKSKKPHPLAVIFFVLGGLLALCSLLFFGLICFVLKLLKEACIDPLEKEARRAGYDLGRELGTAAGHKEGLAEGYESGWKEGYLSGARDGYSAGWKDHYHGEEPGAALHGLEDRVETCVPPEPILDK